MPGFPGVQLCALALAVPSASPDVLAVRCMKVKESLVVSQQEHLSFPLQESFWAMARGHHGLWDTAVHQHPPPSITSTAHQNRCDVTKASPWGGGKPHRVEGESSADL